MLCNFPRGLMTFDDLVTFLHEFGHLVHEICAGQQVWARCSGLIEQQEWDFVEAPSQMLEEWAWTAPVLQRFATNSEGTPIPTELVDALRASRDFCEGLMTSRQLAYAALSHRLHRDHPTDIAPFAEAIEAEFDVREMIPGTHQYASFGHLTDYSACYYTYQWSLAIAKDLFTQFDRGATCWIPRCRCAIAARSLTSATGATPPNRSRRSLGVPTRPTHTGRGSRHCRQRRATCAGEQRLGELLAKVRRERAGHVDLWVEQPLNLQSVHQRNPLATRRKRDRVPARALPSATSSTKCCEISATTRS